MEEDILIPEKVVEISPEKIEEYREVEEVARAMLTRALPWKKWEEGDPCGEDRAVTELTQRYWEEEKNIKAVAGGPETLEKVESPLAERLREDLVKEFGETSLSGKYQPNPR